MVAADADRAALGQPLDDGIRFGTVPDDVAEMPRGIDRPGGREDRIERDEVAVDIRDDCDPHTNEFSSDPLTTACACAPQDRADTVPARDHAR